MVSVAEAVRGKQRSAAEMLDECVARIEASNSDLNAFVHLDLEAARRAAAQVDGQVRRGEDPGPLAGVPFGVKDLEDCAGMPTSHGSLLFKGSTPVKEDSVHVARLRAAGAVPLGKTATPEFGTAAFTSTSAFGITRNPWNRERTPGGSSGGSAAAVAAGMVPFATGSDGGGSIRIPASFSGLVGFKPSFGRVPHPGFGPSQTSCLGAMVTTVGDAARHLDVTAGPDGRDRTSLPQYGGSYQVAAESLDVSRKRALWSTDLGFAVVEPEVAELTRAAARELAEAAGLELVEDEPVSLSNAVLVWLESGAADIWGNLEPGMYPERAEELEPLTRAILAMTSTIDVASYARIIVRRDHLQAEMADLFGRADVLITPATAVPAFAAEGPMPEEVAGQPVNPAMAVPFTMLANLCWNPAVSVPAGTTGAGLPIGLQVVGPRHRDDVVLRLARIWEQTRPWPRHAPGFE